jgi:hypothetical protein
MLTRNLPIFVVFGVALAIGVAALVAWALDDEEEPVPTVNEFNAAQAAKIAYFNSDPTVAAALCQTQRWDPDTDIWRIMCTMEREGGLVERTFWEVAPNGSVTRVPESDG